jgi:hypothetical protein
MKKIKVVVLEVGLDYLERIDYFYMEVPEDKWEAVVEAIKAVEDRGHNVLPDGWGGCNAYCSPSDAEDYIAITVTPSEEGEEE